METSNEPDELLRLIVSAINQSKEPVEVNLAVTLIVGGTIITGALIPNWQWAREQTTFLPEEVAESSIKIRDRIAELMEKEHDELSDDELAELRRPTKFIHLRNAQAFTPVAIPESGMYWRGRLSEVSGWSYGQIVIQDR